MKTETDMIFRNWNHTDIHIHVYIYVYIYIRADNGSMGHGSMGQIGHIFWMGQIGHIFWMGQ